MNNSYLVSCFLLITISVYSNSGMFSYTNTSSANNYNCHLSYIPGIEHTYETSGKQSLELPLNYNFNEKSGAKSVLLSAAKGDAFNSTLVRSNKYNHVIPTKSGYLAYKQVKICNELFYIKAGNENDKIFNHNSDHDFLLVEIIASARTRNKTMLNFLQFNKFFKINTGKDNRLTAVKKCIYLRYNNIILNPFVTNELLILLSGKP